MSLVVKCDDESGCEKYYRGGSNLGWAAERSVSGVSRDLCPVHRPKSERERGAEEMRAKVLEQIADSKRAWAGSADALNALMGVETRVKALKVTP